MLSIRLVFYYFCIIDLKHMQVPVILFFNISGGELLIILLVAFVVFGPNKLPEIARKIGRGLNEVRRASDEIKREITKETRKVESSLTVEEPEFKVKPKPLSKTPGKDSGEDAPGQDTPEKKEDIKKDNPPSAPGTE